jgi:hypothetical protein
MKIGTLKQNILNPNKTKAVRQLGAVDVTILKERVLHLAESVWDDEDGEKPNKFQEFHSTKHIIFKFVRSFDDCRSSYDLPIWHAWKTLVQPILDAAVKDYGYSDGVFSRVMLAKLEAHSQINVHKDGNRAATFPHKIHIPLQTNKSCLFFVNPKQYHFEEGKVYEVNNLTHHHVDNQGGESRIHLIFEYFSEAIFKTAINDSISST